MESFNKMVKPITNVIEQPYISIILGAFLVLYAGTFAPSLPNSVIQFFDTRIGTFTFILLIALSSSVSITVAFVIAIIFILTLITAETRKEGFQNEDEKEDSEEEAPMTLSCPEIHQKDTTKLLLKGINIDGEIVYVADLTALDFQNAMVKYFEDKGSQVGIKLEGVEDLVIPKNADIEKVLAAMLKAMYKLDNPEASLNPKAANPDNETIDGDEFLAELIPAGMGGKSVPNFVQNLEDPTLRQALVAPKSNFIDFLKLIAEILGDVASGIVLIPEEDVNDESEDCKKLREIYENHVTLISAINAIKEKSMATDLDVQTANNTEMQNETAEPTEATEDNEASGATTETFMVRAGSRFGPRAFEQSVIDFSEY